MHDENADNSIMYITVPWTINACEIVLIYVFSSSSMFYRPHLCFLVVMIHVANNLTGKT